MATNIFTTIILYSLTGGVLSLIGGLILLYYRKLVGRTLVHLSTFAAGVLLGAAFLELLPETVEMGQTQNISLNQITMAILTGIVGFFMLERILLRFHGHGHDRNNSHIERTPWLLIIGDTLHNFADGIAIAIAFLTEPSLGVLTTLAVVAHEVPSEIGEFSIMLQAGWPQRRVLLTNIISAFMATVGAIFTYFLRDVITPATPWILAITIGIFIYIAMADLIPEINHQTRQDKASHVVILLVAGILIIDFLSRLLPS